jgi:hypothetical protein
VNEWLWGTNPQGAPYPGRLHIVLDATGRWALCGLWVTTVSADRPIANGRVSCPECCLAAIDHLWPPPAEPVPMFTRSKRVVK